jgi:hypothetical protein
MTYAASDVQPSVFMLKEDNRQSILTVFNWTEGELKRNLRFAELGLKEPGKYQITEVFGDKSCCSPSGDAIDLVQPAHSVRMFKLVEDGIQAEPPAFVVHSAREAKAGETMTFKVEGLANNGPVLSCHWDFGDGSSEDGIKIQHAYTQSGEYTVRVTATGIEAITNSITATVKVSGNIATRFVPANKKRPE